MSKTERDVFFRFSIGTWNGSELHDDTWNPSPWLGIGKWALQKKAVDFFLKLVDKSIDRSMGNVQKNFLPCSSFGKEAISDKLIFKKSCLLGTGL